MNKKQLKEIIVYIAEQCSEDPYFGVTKLNKLLFFTDFFYFLQNHQSLTGQAYLHNHYGPVPKDVEEIRGEMDKQDIAIAHTKIGPYVQQKLVALRKPNISDIEPEKIAFITQIINHFCEKEKSWPATWMSDVTHGTLGYEVTKKDEEIPYNTFYLQNKSCQVLTEEIIEYGKKLSKTYEPCT